jgi:hypothetical protein
MGWGGYGVGWCGVQQDRVLSAMGEEGRRGLDGRCRREPQGRQHLAGFHDACSHPSGCAVSLHVTTAADTRGGCLGCICMAAMASNKAGGLAAPGTASAPASTPARRAYLFVPCEVCCSRK